MGFPPHSLSPAELASVLEAERRGEAFLAYRDGTGDLRLGPLDGLTSVTVGRGEDNDIELAWDAEVSRTHAQLVLIGGEWAIVDDGLSRNGSFVNDERIVGQRRLGDGDVVRLGRTTIVFKAPRLAPESTAVADLGMQAKLTEGERRVLVALCRPIATPGGSGIPAGNREIAAELNISPDGVKKHVRALFAKVRIDDLPQYSKRTELARRALESGLVTQRDLST